VYGVDRSKGGDVFATADDWGLVNLFRNPNAKGSASISYRAHSSHVVRVAFDSGDEYLYSVGGYDRTLMKWKVTRK
jgi:WD40 repeat protein